MVLVQMMMPYTMNADIPKKLRSREVWKKTRLFMRFFGTLIKNPLGEKAEDGKMVQFKMLCKGKLFTSTSVNLFLKNDQHQDIYCKLFRHSYLL